MPPKSLGWNLRRRKKGTKSNLNTCKGIAHRIGRRRVKRRKKTEIFISSFVAFLDQGLFLKTIRVKETILSEWPLLYILLVLFLFDRTNYNLQSLIKLRTCQTTKLDEIYNMLNHKVFSQCLACYWFDQMKNC